MREIKLRQCPLCEATVQAEELQNEQGICELCRLMLEREKEGNEVLR